MALWDKVKQGIDKAGKAAQEVFDEGKLRIDAYRAREQADKAAEALGYAVFRAMEGGQELETEARERLVSALRERENEAKRLETELAEARATAGETAGATGTDSSPAADGNSTAPAPDAPATGSPPPPVDPTGTSGQGGS